MNIAAELNNSILTVFIEGSTWQSVTAVFDKEKVKVERIVYMEDDPVFHDTITTRTGKPETHQRLAFCANLITVDVLKRKLEQAGFGEPYEVRLANDKFTIDKEFTDAYTLTFSEFANNETFLQWLIKAIPSFEADNFMQQLRSVGRYYTREFVEYREYVDLKRFTEHRFEMWHDAVVKEYEEGLAKGSQRCESCEIPDTP